jgi:hypothetical protein
MRCSQHPSHTPATAAAAAADSAAVSAAAAADSAAVSAAAAAAEGAKDTKPEEAEKVTYNPAADFTMQVPANHRRLQELRELRDAAATAAAAAAKQQRQQRTSRGSLFGSSRGYHSSSRSEEVEQLQEMLSSCSIGGSGSVLQLQQRLPFSSSSSSSVSRLMCGSFSSRGRQSNWCGLAAAPLLV